MALTKEQTELLAAAIEKCGDQKKLAEYLGYNATYISQLKRGTAKLRPIVEAALRGIVNSGDMTPELKSVDRLDMLIDATINTAKCAIEASDGCMRLVVKCVVVNLVATLILCGLAARMIWG